MKIDVAPAKTVTFAPPPYEGLPAKGTYRGKVTAFAEPEEDGSPFKFTWEFTARERTWSVDQEASQDELMDILVDLGLAGRTIQSARTVIGKKAMITVRTFGGKTSARVMDTAPISP